MGVSSLIRICIECLPEHAASTLLQLLLLYGRLQQPKQLDIFRHSATTLYINGYQNTSQWGGQHAAEWVAYIAGLRYLRELSVKHVLKLRDKQLLPLTSLAGSLTLLDLTGCVSVGKAACEQVVGCLTSLRSLTLTVTALRPPFLGHLTGLSALTHLGLGGCEVTDAEITCHITAFQNLRQLVLWGASAGDASVPYLAQLPHLQQLSMAWSKLCAVIPFNTSLKCLDLSRCTLDVSWDNIAAAAALAATVGPAAAAAGNANVLGLSGVEQLLLRHTTAAGATCEVLQQLLWSSSSSLRLIELTGASTQDLLPMLLALQSVSGLTALSLAETHLPDDYCPTLVPCLGLIALDLSQNPDVTAAGLAATLPALQQLQRLSLQGCAGVSDAVLPMLAVLPHLQQLVLSGTAITWEWDGSTVAAAAHQPPSSNNGSSSKSNSSCSRHMWRQLKLLDIRYTQLTDAGCLQLQKQLLIQQCTEHTQPLEAESGTPGAAAAGIPQLGLQVLLIGSSAVALGKQALAAVARITSLMHLTLQRWQLVDADLHLLHPLQQLQQLQFDLCDPWLLSDGALANIRQGNRAVLPDLWLLVRDGRTLFAHTAGATAVAATPGDSVKGESGGVDHTICPTPEQHYIQWLSIGSNSAIARGCAVHWPASWGPVASSSSRNTHATAGTAAAGGEGTKAATAAGAHSHSSNGRTPGSKGGSKAQASRETVYSRLSGYDERYRYTTQRLLQIRDAHISHCTGAPAGVAATGQGERVITSDAQELSSVECVPDEIRMYHNAASCWRL